MKTSNFPKASFSISEITNIKDVFQYIQIPIYFFILLLISSLFFPGKLKVINTIQELKKIKIENFTLQSVINKMSPINKRISIYISFLDMNKKEIDINGGLFIACFKDGVSVFNHTGLIPKFKILNSNPIRIFQDFAVDYDTINTTIRIEQKPTFAKRFRVTYIFYNHHFILFNITVKFISLILIFQLIIYFTRKIKLSREIYIEQRLTLILLILTIGYINPLYFTNLISSNQIINLISNSMTDIFYSYLYFYFLSMFTIFITKIKTDIFNTLFFLSIPYSIFIIYIILLLRNEFNSFLYHNSITVLPDFPQSFNDLSDWQTFSPTHMKIFYSFCLFSFFQSLILFSFTQKRQKNQKFYFYLCILLFIVFIVFLTQKFSYSQSYESQKNGLFSCLENFSFLLSVILCSYGQIDLE